MISQLNKIVELNNEVQIVLAYKKKIKRNLLKILCVVKVVMI